MKAQRYGTQCVVVSIDVYKSKNNRYEVFKLWRYPNRTRSCRMGKTCTDFGAGEIMLNSINNDGTLEGYDNDLNRMVAEALGIRL